jgi:serine/threonine-protein phosphatase 2B catalytic subunit
MLIAVLNVCSKEELADEEKLLEDKPGALTDDAEQRRTVIRNKIMAVGKISRVFSVLRENSERVTELKSLSPTGKLPLGTLALGVEGLKSGKTKKKKKGCFSNTLFIKINNDYLAITTFEDAKRSDLENERLPPTREAKEQLLKEETDQRIRTAVNESDEEMEEIADAMMD